MLYGVKPLQVKIWKWCFLSFYTTYAWEQATKTCASLFCFPGMFIVDFSHTLVFSHPSMSEYGYTRQKPAPIYLNGHVQERTAELKKIIDDVIGRRQIYSRYMEKKRRLQESSDVGTMTWLMKQELS